MEGETDFSTKLRFPIEVNQSKILGWQTGKEKTDSMHS